MYPLDHETQTERDLESCFDIKKETVKKVIIKADSHHMSGENLSFYEYQSFYEREMSAEEVIDRSVLVTIFQYLYIGRFFDEKFWKKLLENQGAPMEAHTITIDFSVDDIEL